MRSNQKSPLSGLPVLVIDDDPPSAKLVSVALRADGCVTRTANSAEEAFALMKSFKPRVIILDLILPQMGGLPLAEQLKKRKSTRDIVLIAMSILNGPDVERLAKASGCAAYVRKPIDPLELPNLILAHLGGLA